MKTVISQVQLFAFAFIALGFTAVTKAENLVAFEFTGEITSATPGDDPIPAPLNALNFQVGDTITALVQYELDLTGGDVFGASVYNSSDLSKSFVKVSKNGTPFYESDSKLKIRLLNNDSLPAFGRDELQIEAESLVQVGGLGLEFSIFFNDSQGTALSDQLLPTSYDLSAFDDVSMRMGIPSPNSFGLSTSITSITAVPEPSSLLLGLSAWVGICGVRRRLVA